MPPEGRNIKSKGEMCFPVWKGYSGIIEPPQGMTQGDLKAEASRKDLNK
jgi:hypothetical protein